MPEAIRIQNADCQSTRPRVGDIAHLLRAALPDDLALSEVRKCAPADAWDYDSFLAWALALRNCPRLNWDAYKATYADLQDRDIDPCAHFLKSGMYEGRKLFSWHPLKEADKADAPAISVIVSAYNNGHYLAKGLRSLLNQTFGNLELIVIDDASTDDTPAVIERFAASDKRIKAVFNSDNKGIFMSRKNGVNLAKGRYVMFMDGDDFYHPKACEVAYKEISKGYDIVEGGLELINHAAIEAAELTRYSAYVNATERREFRYKEISDAIYIKGGLIWPLWSKIILRELARAGYNDLKDGFFLIAEDGYALAGISRFARSALKIPFRWYFYNYGTGLSTAKDVRDRRSKWYTYGDATKALGEYTALHKMDINFKRINYNHCKAAIEKWLSSVPLAEAGFYFEHMKKQFSLETLLDVLIAEYSNNIGKIADKLADTTLPGKSELKKIGIFYHRLSPGGVETIIAGLAEMLIMRGFQVAIFVEERSDSEVTLPPEVEVIEIPAGEGSPEAARKHVQGMARAARKSGIDIMLYESGHARPLLWDIISLHDSGIPVVVCHHGSFSFAFMGTDPNYNHSNQESVFRCADAFVCLCRASSAYYRLNGINAWYIPNPVYERTEIPEMREAPQRIAVMGRLGDPTKQIGQSLLVIREVVRKMPWVKAFLIGDFRNETQRREYKEQIELMELEKSVTLTGWTDSPEHFLRQCGVLLSTSYWESFGLAIGEAQALGLPCIAYDISSELIEGNDSVIVVPQWDHNAAANEIIGLLSDTVRWKKLSGKAKVSISRFRPDIHFNGILELLENYDKYTPYTAYNRKDYDKIIKYSAFYSGRNRPKSWLG